MLSTKTIFLIGLLSSVAVSVEGQIISTGVPTNSVSDGYFENFGGGFGFNLRGGRCGFSWGLSWAKGSQRSIVTNAPSLTVQNGAGGSIASGQWTPFVTGVVPIVGQQNFGPRRVDNAVTRAIESGEFNRWVGAADKSRESRIVHGSVAYGNKGSSAMRGVASVAAIKAAREKTKNFELRRLGEILSEARALVEKNELPMARSKFREAWRMTENESVRQAIKSEIDATR